MYQAVGGEPSAGLRFAGTAAGVNMLGEAEFDALLELDGHASAAHAVGIANAAARVALRVSVRDLAVARACLQAAGVAWQQTAQGLRIAPADAGGAWLLMSAA